MAIARALANDPKVLLSDEATSALDPETTASILQLLQRINQQLGLTIVLITHEMEVIKAICDRAAILDAGHVAEIGPVIDLFSAPQSEVAKSLTRSALHIDLPDEVRQQLLTEPGEGRAPIVRLSFVGDQVNKPILASISEKFSVEANIMQATLSEFNHNGWGLPCVNCWVRQHKWSRPWTISNSKVKVEVRGYVSIDA